MKSLADKVEAMREAGAMWRELHQRHLAFVEPACIAQAVIIVTAFQFFGRPGMLVATLTIASAWAYAFKRWRLARVEPESNLYALMEYCSLRRRDMAPVTLSSFERAHVSCRASLAYARTAQTIMAQSIVAHFMIGVFGCALLKFLQSG